MVENFIKIDLGGDNGHYCNHVSDPASCCPCGHGEPDERFCTCKVSGEMRDAVLKFTSELELESWRQLDVSTRKWILRKHRIDNPSNPTYVSCRIYHGSGPLKNGKCCFCGEEVDWVTPYEQLKLPI